MNTGKIANLA